MIETHAEVLSRWAAPYGGAMCSQRQGKLSWLAMTGSNNEYVTKGSMQLGSMSVYSLRGAMRSLKEFWTLAVD